MQQEVIIGGVLALVLAAGAVAVVGQMSSAPTAGSSAPKAVTPPKAAAPVAPTPPKATPPPSPKAETKNEEKPADYDVSVPYDAAARLAYVEMLSKLTPPNDAADYYFSQYLIEEEPFAVFKKQYEEETVAAIKAKQKVPVQA